jgi:hypothetical protein
MYIPTYLNQRNVDLPAPDGSPARCIVADNGIFLERRSPMYSTCARIDMRALNLAIHDEYCHLMTGRIPRVVHRAMLAFFKCAHALHDGEAALVLLYHPLRRIYRWHCPLQVIDQYRSSSGWYAGDLIEFQNPLVLPEGYVNFGDAHLHFGSPTPSKIDVCDDQDGLHIIVGNIRSDPTYHITFVMDGARFQFAADAIFDDPKCRPFRRPPRTWLGQVRVRSVENGYAVTRTLLDTLRHRK